MVGNGRPLRRVVLVAGLVVVCGATVGACGRKAGLDPPPSAGASVPPGTAQPDPSSTWRSAGPIPDAGQTPPSPTATPATRDRWFPLDWLLN